LERRGEEFILYLILGLTDEFDEKKEEKLQITKLPYAKTCTGTSK